MIRPNRMLVRLPPPCRFTSINRSKVRGGHDEQIATSPHLMPMDLSPMSMNALHWANVMACAREAELRAFHVVTAARATIPERLGFLERDRHMVKLREALASVDSTNERTSSHDCIHPLTAVLRLSTLVDIQAATHDHPRACAEDGVRNA